MKFPSHGGTSTLAGVLKYLNEELSGGIAVVIEVKFCGLGILLKGNDPSVCSRCGKEECGEHAEDPREPGYAEVVSDGDDVGACS